MQVMLNTNPASVVIPAKGGIQYPANFSDHALPSSRPPSPAVKLLYCFVTICCFFWTSTLHAAPAPDLEDQTRTLAEELRCVVCQNLSVADSPSEMAQQMRAIVREQLQAGKTPDQVKDFFVSKYGEWVLLKPKTSGISLLLWLLPYIALAAGVLVALWSIRRWTKRKALPLPARDAARDRDRLRSEILRDDFERPDSEDTSPRADLLRERALLRAELSELEFDFQSGKHSEAEFMALQSEIENKAAALIEKFAALPPPAPRQSAKDQKPVRESTRKTQQTTRGRLRRWQIAAGGVFLLLFGLTLGIFLTQSLRPRMSEQDTITGDFMTGTGGGATAALLQEGKQAFAKQDFAKAIEVFKQVLAQEPNQPEGHAYMGFILVHAGDGDGALLAFDKALAVAPDFPMTLWGKGMVLLHEKQDYSAAREVLEKLVRLLPAGAKRSEVEKTLAQVPQSGAVRQETKPAPAPTGQQITGKISIDPKLKGNVDSQATLFIIARPAGADKGPPLAVRKIERPVFPLSYSLGAENVMMQGIPFTGSVAVIARLDKDGNPTTRQPGDLTGDYQKNPVAVSSQNIDIVLDQVVQ